MRGSSPAPGGTARVTCFVSLVSCVCLVLCTACTNPSARADGPDAQAREESNGTGPRRVPSAASPFRVDLIGDSMAAALGGGFSSALRAGGAAAAVDRGWWGFGFTSGWTAVRNGRVFLPAIKEFRDWPEKFAAFVARDDPDAFVAYVGGWDLAPRVVDGRVLTPPSAAWQAFYAGLLDRATSILTSKGAIFYIFGPPCDGEGPTEKGYNQGTALLREIFSELATRHPGKVVYLDLDPLLCPTGKPSDDATTSAGSTIRVFDDHFTPAGARFVGEWFVDQVASTWYLRRVPQDARH